jgi:hypothetical protein
MPVRFSSSLFSLNFLPYPELFSDYLSQSLRGPSREGALLRVRMRNGRRDLLDNKFLLDSRNAAFPPRFLVRVSSCNSMLSTYG